MRDIDRIKEKVVIELDNSQVGYGILAFLAVTAGVFAAGVLVGQRMGDVLPHHVAQLAGIEATWESREAYDSPTERYARLASVEPGTRTLVTELVQTRANVDAADPTTHARIQAHRQMAQARKGHTARSMGLIPLAAANTPPPTVEPVTVVRRAPNGAVPTPSTDDAQGFTLQVSAFDTQGPAEVVARQLRTAGHPARVEALSATGPGGRYRVEVGNFSDARGASAFQSDFEQRSGYSTIVVAKR